MSDAPREHGFSEDAFPEQDRTDHEADTATGETPHGGSPPTEAEIAAAALQAGLTPRAAMPAELRRRLEGQGLALTAAARRPRAPVGLLVLLAACVLIAAGAGIGLAVVWERAQASEARANQLASRIEENERLLADARAAAEASESRAVDLAARLASAAAALDDAEARIARYETPVDPAKLQQDRRKLLDVPGTVRLAWQPFELPGADAPEQPGVTGDVVWNDELETGYLRFVGLEVNDPAEEQYQVWVVDERGLEQKVSGGVFNATADGEVIVPIDPGIDVGRVQLFAVTVEEPGGTWVPTLDRRVVVAPRGDG